MTCSWLDHLEQIKRYVLIRACIATVHHYKYSGSSILYFIQFVEAGFRTTPKPLTVLHVTSSVISCRQPMAFPI